MQPLQLVLCVDEAVADRLHLDGVAVGGDRDYYLHGVELARAAHHRCPVECQLQARAGGHFCEGRQCQASLVVGLAEFQVVLLQVDGVARRLFQAVAVQHEGFGGRLSVGVLGRIDLGGVARAVVFYGLSGAAVLCPRLQPLKVIAEVYLLDQAQVVHFGDDEAQHGSFHAVEVAPEGHPVAVELVQAERGGCVDDGDGVGRVFHGEGAAVEHSGDGQPFAAGGVVAVEVGGDVGRFGVLDGVAAGEDAHVIAGHVGQRAAVGVFRALDVDAVAHADSGGGLEEDVGVVGVVADDAARGADGCHEGFGHDDHGLVGQGGQLVDGVFLAVAVLVSVLRDGHFGTAGQCVAPEDDGGLAGIVDGAFAQVVGDGHGDFRGALSGDGRHANPFGQFVHHPLGVGIDGDDLLGCVFCLEVQGRGAGQHGFGHGLLVVVAASAQQGGQHEGRGCYVILQFHVVFSFLEVVWFRVCRGPSSCRDGCRPQGVCLLSGGAVSGADGGPVWVRNPVRRPSPGFA